MSSSSRLELSDALGPRTLFHLHTRRTDGRLEVEDYFQFAVEYGVERLVFLEHVRRNPTYSTLEFAEEIIRYRDRLKIPAAVGFEAKILADGQLDIDAATLELAEVVGIAEHGRHLGFEELTRSLRGILKEFPSAHPATKFVWVHPGLSLARADQMDQYRSEYGRLLREAEAAGVLVEKNLRYDLLADSTWLELGLRPVLGADAHDEVDLQRWADYIKQRQAGGQV